MRQGLIVSVLAVVAFWLGTSIWNLGSKVLIAVSEANEAQLQYEEIHSRKAALEASVATLSTERGKDAAIRTTFGVAREGEEVIVVVPPQATTTPVVEKSWWEKVLEWF